MSPETIDPNCHDPGASELAEVIAELEEQPGYMPPPGPVALADLALEFQVERMEAYGNVLSAEHKRALDITHGKLASIFFGRPGRWAFGLECGVGKTQAAVSFVQAANALGLLGPAMRSVVICCAQIEALCAIKRDLARLAPELRIGLHHQSAVDPDAASWVADPVSGLPMPPIGYVPARPKLASLPADANAFDCPVLLVTHMKVKRASGADFNSYLGRKRDLVIYDESLMRADAKAVLWQPLREAFAIAAERNLAPAAKAFLRDARLILEEVVELQTSSDAHPASIALRLPDDANDKQQLLKELEAGLLQTNATSTSRNAYAALAELVAMADQPMVIAGGGHPTALLSYEPNVPADLDRVAVLDASYSVRKLYEFDVTCGGHKSIGDALSAIGVVKRFDHVKLYFTRHPSGREATTTDLAKGTRGFFVPYVAEAIRRSPADEAVLIFTFGKAGDCEDRLRAGLRSMGVEVDGKIPDGRPRINILPWGQQTSRSDLKFCTTVIYAGLMYRSQYGLNAAIRGQAHDIERPTTSTEVRAVLASELVHAIMQSAQRGSARDMTDGQAHPMTIHLAMADQRTAVRRGLKAAMPGLQWINEDDEDGVGAEAIADHLASLPMEQDQVSKISLGRVVAAKFGGTPGRKRLERIFEIWSEDALGEWELDGRNVRRVRS